MSIRLCQKHLDEFRDAVVIGKNTGSVIKCDLCNSVFEYNVDATGVLFELSASRNAWRKVAEELGENYVEGTDSHLGIWHYVCWHCECELSQPYQSTADWVGNHSPDCPIEQLRDLQRSEG